MHVKAHYIFTCTLPYICDLVHIMSPYHDEESQKYMYLILSLSKRHILQSLSIYIESLSLMLLPKVDFGTSEANGILVN